MKKILPIILVGVLIFSGLGAAATNGDELDQSQELYDGVIPIGCNLRMDYGNVAAQSFIPQKDVLTRVRLNMSRMATASEPCYVAIKDNMSHPNLAEVGLGPENFSVAGGMDVNLTWTEFDFGDLRVTINETYYIVVYTDNVAGNVYFWSGLGDMADGPYPYGMLYRSEDGGENWNDYPMSDTCFKTYGKDDQNPTVTIENPSRGYLHILGIPVIKLASNFIADAMGFGGFRSLGPVTINATDDFDNNEDLNISIYINDILVENATITYCSECGFHMWQWLGPATGFYTLKVKAEDSYGNIGYSSTIKVLYICLM